jgi:hypothetical protein
MSRKTKRKWQELIMGFLYWQEFGIVEEGWRRIGLLFTIDRPAAR